MGQLPKFNTENEDLGPSCTVFTSALRKVNLGKRNLQCMYCTISVINCLPFLTVGKSKMLSENEAFVA